jgi:hypothetical protein
MDLSPTRRDQIREDQVAERKGPGEDGNGWKGGRVGCEGNEEDTCVI